ncbi:MAG TPA: TetR/AcrR family transcriptional regulator [Oceanospirillales bacterium]|nr:TetR/AcrR family transcriptional regulator [Oceanospirillales bacterium]
MKAGRKRLFDVNETLEKAMLIFWENGFSGTSLTDLTSGLGINKPSLYAAFGNKEQLYSAALNYYLNNFSSPRYAKLTEPKEDDLKTRLHSLLYNLAQRITDTKTPKGCLFVNSSCESGGNGMPDSITQSIKDYKKDSHDYLVNLFDHEQQQGHLDSAINSAEISTHLMVVMFGMCVLAKNGSHLADLIPVINLTVNTILNPQAYGAHHA